jgi:hypothetical protein
MYIIQLSWCGEVLSETYIMVTCIWNIVGPAECFPALNFVRICLPKKQMVPQKQGQI